MSKDDPLYVNTRKFILSEYNPYFFKVWQEEAMNHRERRERVLEDLTWALATSGPCRWLSERIHRTLHCNGMVISRTRRRFFSALTGWRRVRPMDTCTRATSRTVWTATLVRGLLGRIVCLATCWLTSCSVIPIISCEFAVFLLKGSFPGILTW